MKTFDDDVTDILINLDFQITVTPDNETTSKHIIKAKQALKEAIDKQIIGKDQDYTHYGQVNEFILERNILRKDQRRALWGKEGEENGRN